MQVDHVMEILDTLLESSRYEGVSIRTRRENLQFVSAAENKGRATGRVGLPLLLGEHPKPSLGEAEGRYLSDLESDMRDFQGFNGRNATTLSY